MTTLVSDLVRESKLEAEFHPTFVQHVQFVAGSTPRQRKVRKEERWMRESVLGHGAFGVVRLERCIHGDAQHQLRAVKELRKVASQTYHRELEAIALFSYSKYERCFVKSFGWYEDDRSIFIAMEYLPAGDLQQHLKSPLPEEESKRIVSQILEGLDFMHSNRFTHRDLKPANILVVCTGPEWWVKLADFGISKRATVEQVSLRTQTGTPAFMAPEMLGFGSPRNSSGISYTSSVDIWSTGVIAFMILTGKVLFNDPGLLHQYVAGTLELPGQILSANNVSRQGQSLVKALMDPMPQRRPRTSESLHFAWFESLSEARPSTEENKRYTNLQPPNPGPSQAADPEASASWDSIQNNTSNYQQEHSATLKRNNLPDVFKAMRLEPIIAKSNAEEERKPLSPIENLVRRVSGSSLEKVEAQHPTKRRLVQIFCPGRRCGAGQVSEWVCSECDTTIEYGFTDQFLYCGCGRGLYTTYEFKCNSDTHGSAFERFPPADLRKLLENLPAYNELNILILGPIGSGKSTFVNAFISYLSAQTFDEAARSDKFQWAAPYSFLLQTLSTEGEIEETRISNDLVGGKQDDSHDEPTTKHSKIYTITRGLTRYRLIDTPGIGAKLAPEKDDQYIADIISTLRDCHDLVLNGVLVLLKPDISRVSIRFTYSMERILSVLHRDTTSSLVFGFSDTHKSNNTPGYALTSLNALLRKHPDIGISLERRNSFCFDFETFRFLATKNQGVTTPTVEGLHKSWTHSRAEVWRMLNRFKSSLPLSIDSVIAVEDTRNVCSGLGKSLMNCAWLLQLEEHEYNRMLRAFKEKEENIKKLQQQLRPLITSLRTKPLDRPRLVCSNAHCISIKDAGDGNLLTDYKSPCQDPCYLTDVVESRPGSPGLMECAAFLGQEYCLVCRHHWTEHLHITYTIERYTETIVDSVIEKALTSKMMDKKLLENLIENSQRRIHPSQSELKAMLSVAARLNLWLSEWSIISNNDIFLELLDKLTYEEEEEEEEKPPSAGDKSLVLPRLRDWYAELMRSLAPEAGNFGFDRSERTSMLENLFKMKHLGETLQNSFVALQPVTGGLTERTNREKMYRVTINTSRKASSR